MNTLFDSAEPSRHAPLAVRMRPKHVDEIIGHRDILAPGAPLTRLLEQDRGAASVMLWGPPGSGKTTIASVLAHGRQYRELSAVTAGVRDVRAVIDDAKRDLAMFDRTTVLFIDEVHRFNKAQQDALLPAVENGWVTLIAATTENPHFSVVAPLLSRSILVRMSALNDSDIDLVLDRALTSEQGLDGEFHLEPQAREHVIRLSGGDARRALTALEASTHAAKARGSHDVSDDDVSLSLQHAGVLYDKDGDQHYDVMSAFIKSVRGSDVNAALHYLARMLEAGEDPRFVARRLMILASEDIGMADNTALLTASAAASAVATLGMPEARITLAHATVHCALAPKSNAVYTAIDAAITDVRAGGIGTVPTHLRDAHYSGAQRLGHGATYVYPHDRQAGIAAQQYLPEGLPEAEYYRPTDHGAEARWAEVYRRAQAALSGEGLGLPENEGELGSS